MKNFFTLAALLFTMIAPSAFANMPEGVATGGGGGDFGPSLEILSSGDGYLKCSAQDEGFFVTQSELAQKKAEEADLAVKLAEICNQHKSL